ncbi:ATP-binding cassette sub-family C member 4-like isoform X2 [Babylonia areolata]|uniref:ATP-binding cassette sub-family C member 4-like isoform X2 n=1 Tax=Babylonia areolata TaxID=304850 RepID=UPI003FD4B6E2
MDETARHFNPSPMQSANWISRVLFWWLNPLMKKGHKKELSEEDLFSVVPQDSADHLSVGLEREWQRELQKEKDSGGTHKPSLLKALARLFGLRYLLLGLIVLTEESVRVVQPLLLGGLIEYFTASSTMTTKQAYLYALGVSLATLLMAFTHAYYFFAVARIGMQMRVACSSLMFKKAVWLNNSGMSQTTTGHIVNLMSNDVSRFDKGAMFLHFLVIGPLQAIVVLVILWIKLGPSVVGGFVVVLLLIPVQGIMGKMFSKLRHKTALHTDERVKVMNEIISGMRVIKMYCWEKHFGELVEKIRRSELKYVWAKKRINAFTSSVWLFAHRVLSYAVVVMHVCLGGTVRAAPLYIALSFMFLLAYNGVGCVFEGVSRFSEFCVASARVQKFLLLAEKHRQESVVCSHHRPAPDDCMVVIDNLSAKWNPEVEQNTLDQISATVKAGQLLAVIGPVGAGKSSLLMALLGELQASAGSVSVKGKVAYVSQQAWVFSGSLRQNILFGSVYEKGRFDKAVWASALRKDLEIMPQGDSTLIGDRGVSLSGGQRARVSLARALYSNADVYLLDDPLSAVDAAVGHHIFQKCIQGALRNKPRILVTHQLQYLTSADSILILKEGRAVGMGTYDELSKSGIDFTELLKTSEEEEGAGEPPPQLLSPVEATPLYAGCGSQMSLVSEATDFEPDPVQLPDEEERQTGSVNLRVYRDYFAAGTGVLGFLLLLLFLLAAQASYVLSDWWLSRWCTAEEDRLGAIQVHQHLLSQGYNRTDVVIPVVDEAHQVLVYSVIIVSVFVFGIVRALLFFRIVVNASQQLHNRMFASVVRCPIGFFDTNPVGRILNRFAKDVDNMDDILPVNFFDFLQCFLLIVGIVLVVSVANVWVFLPTAPLLVLFFYIRSYYLATSRSIKRLEGTCRSPVYSYLSASLQGVQTIRAFRMAERCEEEFRGHQDDHTRAWLLFMACSRWLSVRLDLLCALFVTCVTFLAVFAADSLDAGTVGLSVTYAMTLMGMFQWGVRQSAEVENQMVSVERVLEYSRLPSEASLESSGKDVPPPDWPQRGSVRADNLCLQYSPEGPLVLKNISFCIDAREKVGIVGRTGAGKSSLITALFRLVEPSGVLTIDRVDVRDLGLHDLRKCISIIPQDPVLFTGSLRRNLDPFVRHSDHQLWKVLAEVQLKSVVEDLPSGLETSVSEGGVNFSVGQRQLICLARAILRQNRILVIDEATANVDPKTDEMIQQTIHDKFRDCTVLTIAHRLHTIMESDRVLVLSEGRIVEFDAPHRLLQDTSGMFHSMVRQTGKAEAENLASIAAHAYSSRLPKTDSGSSGFESSVEGQACKGYGHTLPDAADIEERNSAERAGERAGVSGERTSVSGERTGVSGERTGVSGESTGVTGERTGVTGERTGVTGVMTGVTGERTGVSGERTGVSGERTGMPIILSSLYDMNLVAPMAVAESFHSLLGCESEDEDGGGGYGNNKIRDHNRDRSSRRLQQDSEDDIAV